MTLRSLSCRGSQGWFMPDLPLPKCGRPGHSHTMGVTGLVGRFDANDRCGYRGPSQPTHDRAVGFDLGPTVTEAA